MQRRRYFPQNSKRIGFRVYGTGIAAAVQPRHIDGERNAVFHSERISDLRAVDRAGFFPVCLQFHGAGESIVGRYRNRDGQIVFCRDRNLRRTRTVLTGCGNKTYPSRKGDHLHDLRIFRNGADGDIRRTVYEIIQVCASLADADGNRITCSLRSVAVCKQLNPFAGFSRNGSKRDHKKQCSKKCRQCTQFSLHITSAINILFSVKWVLFF